MKKKKQYVDYRRKKKENKLYWNNKNRINYFGKKGIEIYLIKIVTEPNWEPNNRLVVLMDQEEV